MCNKELKMKTKFFPHPPSELTYMLADKVNQWHERHEKFHNDSPPFYTPLIHNCMISTASGTNYFAITYNCDFED